MVKKYLCSKCSFRTNNVDELKFHHWIRHIGLSNRIRDFFVSKRKEWFGNGKK